jgi:hypothetical protein
MQNVGGICEARVSGRLIVASSARAPTAPSGPRALGALPPDRRAEQAFLDAEAVLQEARQIQEHLAAQDAALVVLAEKLGASLPRQPATPGA